jgi:hypothetical protein
MFTELSAALGSVKAVLDVLKGTKDLLPESPEKQAATVSLDAAERALRIAEAKAAEELDYHLCRCTFPPADRTSNARRILPLPEMPPQCPRGLSISRWGAC